MKTLKLAEINEKIENGETFVAILSADWCTPCHTLHHTIDQLQPKLVNSEIVYFEDGDFNPACDKWQIRSVPTILKFANGGLAVRHSGNLVESKLIEKFGLS